MEVFLAILNLKDSLWTILKTNHHYIAHVLSFLILSATLAAGVRILVMVVFDTPVGAAYLASGGAITSSISLFAPPLGSLIMRALRCKYVLSSQPPNNKEHALSQLIEQAKPLMAFYSQVTATFVSSLAFIILFFAYIVGEFNPTLKLFAKAFFLVLLGLFFLLFVFRIVEKEPIVLYEGGRSMPPFKSWITVLRFSLVLLGFWFAYLSVDP